MKLPFMEKKIIFYTPISLCANYIFYTALHFLPCKSLIKHCAPCFAITACKI